MNDLQASSRFYKRRHRAHESFLPECFVGTSMKINSRKIPGGCAFSELLCRTLRQLHTWSPTAHRRKSSTSVAWEIRAACITLAAIQRCAQKFWGLQARSWPRLFLFYLLVQEFVTPVSALHECSWWSFLIQRCKGTMQRHLN